MGDQWIGFTATGLTLLVTVTLFAVEYVRRRRADGIESRRKLLERVLDVVERATRSMVRGPIASLWSPTNVEYLLVLPRLAAELPKRDQVIALWAARRVQHIQAARSEKEVLTIGLSIAAELINWHHGTRKRSWFQEQVQADPWLPDFSAPMRSRFERGARESWNWFRLGAGAAAVALSVRHMFRTV